jgi:cytochrome c556
MHRSFKTVHGVSLVAVAMLTTLFVSLRAQQPPAPAPQTPTQPAPAQQPAGRGTAPAPAGAPAAPAPKPLVPVATNTITANPDAFYGQAVTITASVEQIFTKSSFTVDQRRVPDAPAPKQPTDVLVLVPTIQRPVDLKSYVTVMGELIKFDPAEVAKKAKDYKIDLPPDAAAKYAGRPVLIATSVINDKFDDVAKRLPPPLTAEEESFQKVMRAVGPAAAALRPAVESLNAEVAAKNAAVLQKGFADTEAFWKPKKAEPTLWAQNARKEVEALQAAITAGNWNEAKTHAATVAQACGQCHGAYRERFDDGSFRVKK